MKETREMDFDKAAEYWITKDRDSVQMAEEEITKRIEVFISAHNTCALATASFDFVRCTPIEYNYVDKCFFLFSEGGLKFRCLKENSRVALAIYEPYTGFHDLKSLQVTGTAEIIKPFSEEYLRLLAHKKIPEETMRKLPEPMHLIKIRPTDFDYLDSDLKKEGFGIRQHLSSVFH